MTKAEFNKKYEHLIDYNEIVDGTRIYFDGLCFDNKDVIEFLDEIFENVCSKIHGFKFKQIKIKFGKCCFYSNIEGYQFELMVEQRIDEILKEKLTE